MGKAFRNLKPEEDVLLEGLDQPFKPIMDTREKCQSNFLDVIRKAEKKQKRAPVTNENETDSGCDNNSGRYRYSDNDSDDDNEVTLTQDRICDSVQDWGLTDKKNKTPVAKEHKDNNNNSSIYRYSDNNSDSDNDSDDNHGATPTRDQICNAVHDWARDLGAAVTKLLQSLDAERKQSVQNQIQLTKTVEELKKENMRLLAEKWALNSLSEGLKKTEGTMKTELATQQSRIDVLQAAQEELRKNNERLEAAKTSLEQDKRSITRQLAEETKAKEELKEEKEALTRAYQELKKEKESLAKDNSDQKKKLKEKIRASVELNNHIKKLQEDKEELQMEKTCSICMERPKDTLLECGHSGCRRCIAKMSNCHICRDFIKTTRRIFFN